MLDMEVFPRVYLGTKDSAKDINFIIEKRIAFVLNVTPDLRNHFENITELTANARNQLPRSNSSSQSASEPTTATSLDLFDYDDESSKENIEPTTTAASQQSIRVVDLIPPAAGDNLPTPPSSQSPLPLPSPTTVMKIPKITYKRISVLDSMEENLSQFFPAAITFINDALATAESCVLVHCREARSRSVTILIAYAMHELGLDLKTAYNKLSDAKNGNIAVNDGFKRQLMEFECKIRSVEKPSMDFFPQRKRVRSYSDMINSSISFLDSDSEPSDEDDESYTTSNQRTPKSANGRTAKKPKISRANGIVATPFPEIHSADLSKAKKQPTLMELLQMQKQRQEQAAKAAAAAAAAAAAEAEVRQQQQLAAVQMKKQTSILSFFRPR